MTYSVAIPSRGRADTLMKKTLPLLLNRGVPSEAITVFVEADEQDKYRAVVPDGVSVMRGARGLAANRNAIADFYQPYWNVVQIDDDIDDVVRRLDDTTTVPVASFDKFFEEAFAQTRVRNLRLWGVYPVLNAMFMQDTVTEELRFIVGGLFGVVNAPERRLEIDDKEDFERTLRYYTADGGVVRFNQYAFKTRYYTGKGGMQAEARTEEQNRCNAERLVEMFPGLATLNTTKKSGRTDLRLRDRRLPNGMVQEALL